MSGEPKPLWSENNASYCRFGAERLAKLLETLENQIDGVIENEDVEYIHRMRVASRRIRAAMPLFRDCFPKRKYKKWLKKVKEVTRLLGDARDLDVQIALMQRFKSKNGTNAESPIADLLLKNHKTIRAKIQPDIVRTLKGLQDSGILREMQEFFHGTAEDLQSLRFILASVLEKAYWNIAYRIDDLLVMEQYVYEENEVLKHHEMRIRAKWLRYTMETFSQLYENKLTEETEVMKRYQDVLGEVHDCDVLTEYARDFIMKTKRKTAFKAIIMQGADGEQSLVGFLEYLKEQRKSHYSTFVNLWENDRKSGFFEKLRETTRNGVSTTEDMIKELETKPQAEIAVLSDVHGNLHALRAVIENAEKRGINSFLNTGDLIGYGPYPKEVIELLQSKNTVSVAGNVDLEVFQSITGEKKEKKIAMEFARKQVSKSYRTYLFSLPRCVRLEIAGKRLFMTHGSPESIDEHLYADTPMKRLNEIAKEVKADVIITGHSHQQYVRELSGACFLNPGSVGRPYDNNPQAGYAVVKLNPLSFELVRVNYDAAAAAQASRKKGLPESFSQAILRGVALERIAKDDHERKAAEANDCLKITRNCRKISKEYWPDTEHYEQVRKLSLRLLDELQSVHEFGNVERCWLECASILHDIGLSTGVKGHHKKTMKLILNDERLVFASEERRIIASIARYHRKRFPNKKDYNLASLSSNNTRKIILLSGILRSADSLDYSHNRIVENLRLRIGSKRITVECTSRSNTELEQRAFMKKKDLIEKALNRKMALAWQRH
jgi:putative phosphoesterase